MIPWLIANNDAASAAIAKKLAQRGVDVRPFDRDDASSIVAALHGAPFGALFTTPAGVAALAAAIAGDARVCAVCVGKPTLAAASSTPFAKASVLVPHGADIVEFVCSLEEKA